MEKEIKKGSKKRLWVWGTVCAVALLLIVLVTNIEPLQNVFSRILLILRPVILGLVIAYLCNPIFRFYERGIFSRLRPPAFRRAVSLILTYLTVFAIFGAILWLILPQLIESILSFANNYSQYLSSAVHTVNSWISGLNKMLAGITGRNDFLAPLSEKTLQLLFERFTEADVSSYIETIKQPLTDAISVLADLFIGLFISIYLLASKEKRYAQIMKVRHAVFGDKTNEVITKFCTVADRSFGAFFEGKILDSFIVGILLWPLLALFGVPYAILLTAIVAIANIIPLIGPLIGAIPSTVILLLSEPGKVIPFLIAVIIIQQIDCNIISPKILGNNTGVSSLCVLIAIVCAGSFWGITGMLLGVPLFATILILSEQAITTRLQKKGIPSGLENYYDPNAMVDPSKYAHATTDKFMQRFERRAFRIQKKKNNGEHLTGKEKRMLYIYRALLKYHFVVGLSEEDQLRFTASEVAKTAEQEARDCFESYESLYTCTQTQDAPVTDRSTEASGKEAL